MIGMMAFDEIFSAFQEGALRDSRVGLSTRPWGTCALTL